MVKTIKARAYSIVEIISVVAIVGILSSVAISTFRTQRNKVKVSNAVTFMMSIAKQAAAENSLHDEYPAILRFQKLNMVPDTDFWVGRSNVGAVKYIRITDPSHAEFGGMRLYFSITGLSLDGAEYEEPEDSAGKMFTKGSEIRLFMDRNFNISCGTHAGEAFLPEEVLVPPCRCVESSGNIINDCRIRKD